jgi:hypothetical protein
MANGGRQLWLLLSFFGLFVSIYFIFTLFNHFEQVVNEEGPGITLRWTYALRLTGGLIFLLILIVTIRIIVKLFGGRHKRTRVFISYFHEYSDIASEIRHALELDNMRVALIPFSDYEYDKLIAAVRKEIVLCDCVIVIPGKNRSFVDAEVLAASVLVKPMLFIDIGHRTAPDTALSGYPVFQWKIIKKLECKAIPYFIRFITPNCCDEITRTAGIIKNSLSHGFILSFAIAVISYAMEIISLPLGINYPVIIEDYSERTFWILYCLLLIYVLVLGLFQIFKVDIIARQLSVTGTRTKEKLISLLRSTYDSKLRVRALLISSLENEMMQRRG